MFHLLNSDEHWYRWSAIDTYLLNNSWTIQLSCNISYFLQILTEKGVFEQKAKIAVTHASNEKMRRQELFDSFQMLGSILVPKELRHKTNRYDILKLVIINMSTLYLTEYMIMLVPNTAWISGPKRDKLTGDRTKWDNEQLRNLYFLPYIEVVRSGRMKWVGHVACFGEKRNANKVLVGKPEGTRSLGMPKHKKKIRVPPYNIRIIFTVLVQVVCYPGHSLFCVYLRVAA